jgi:hypothetical protein
MISFVKIWTIEIKYNKFMLVYFENFWHMKCSNHTSYFLYEVCLNYAPSKPYWKNSNLVTYKPIIPPRSMCQSKHYLFTTKRYVPIKNWNNMK